MVRARPALESRVNGPIVFIAAEPRECAPWVAKWNGVEKLPLNSHWARRGEWRGNPMIAIANGAGAQRAYHAALQIPQPAQLWNIGFGGATNPELRVGDIFVADRISSDEQAFPCRRPRASFPFRSGEVRTIAHIARTAQEKSDHYRSGASVIEMEAAGIARAASEKNAPFYCVRAVSDLASETFVNDFSAALRPDGRFSAARLAFGAILRPRGRFAELLRLWKRTDIAAKNLGEFLAHCEF
jgi:nucleoside phosphorylase